jgi:hypothetical protein
VEQSAVRFLSWLAEPHDRRWLIVIDDLTDPNDLSGLWPPATPWGRTVVTTRRRDAALMDGRQMVDLSVFTAAEAGRYLTAKLHHAGARRAGVLDEAAGLAADLGHLPLALAQAAAYIDDLGLTCADYRRRLSSRRRRLADLAPASRPDGYRATVAATWSLSIELADGLPPRGLARPVLEVAALLDPNTIPTGLFATSAMTRHFSEHAAEPVDADDLRDALQLVHRLSLISLDDTATTVAVHRLVQRAVRDDTRPDQVPHLATSAADAVLELWPHVEPDSTRAQDLRTNVAALRDHAGDHLWSADTGAHPVLFRTGTSLGETGLVRPAADYFQRLHTDAVQHLGPEHRHTLRARSDHAWWCGEAGDPTGAVTTYRELLPCHVRLLGADHVDTLTIRHNLAWWRGEAGDPAGAAAALGELLPDHIRVLGRDHPDTLVTRHNIALFRGMAGDVHGALAAFEAVLPDRIRAHGPDHREVLATRTNIARWRGESGDPAGAAAAFEELVNDAVRVLGTDHPVTLTSRAFLADWQSEAGDPAGAAATSEELLADQNRILGQDHPHTLATRHNLARQRAAAGDPAWAVSELTGLLSDQQRILGPDHPYTLFTRSTLAFCQGLLGNTAAAVTALTELHPDMLRVFGAEHPETHSVGDDLAYWRSRSTR